MIGWGCNIGWTAISGPQFSLDIYSNSTQPNNATGTMEPKPLWSHIFCSLDPQFQNCNSRMFFMEVVCFDLFQRRESSKPWIVTYFFAKIRFNQIKATFREFHWILFTFFFVSYWSRNIVLGWSKLWMQLHLILAPFKIIYPKYSKHWSYTLAHTINCVCSKMLNHGLNHGLFLSLFKPCHIHWIVLVLVYLNFILEF